MTARIYHIPSREEWLDPSSYCAEELQRDPDEAEAASWAMLFFAGLAGFVSGFFVACVTLILLARVLTGNWM